MDDLDKIYCSCSVEGRDVELTPEGEYICLLCKNPIYIHEGWYPQRKLNISNSIKYTKQREIRRVYEDNLTEKCEMCSKEGIYCEDCGGIFCSEHQLRDKHKCNDNIKGCHSIWKQ